MIDSLPPPLNRAPGNGQEWLWAGGLATAFGAERSGPRITVITPSFNQAEFLEMTIRSVLGQGYPNLEYLVMDGGSRDGSVQILEHYSPWLSGWESEPDRGQSHAINKGLARATGEIVCWLNSDDFYLPGTLEVVGRLLSRESGARAIAGHVDKVYLDGREPVRLEGRYEGRRQLLEIWRPYQMHQAAIFWRRELTEEIGLLREDLNLIMDFDYWVRLSRVTSFVNVDRVLAGCHYHAAAKTGDDYASYHAARRRRVWRYWGSPARLEFWDLALRTLKNSWWPAWRG
ncbi:MAG: glycosyltransferase family 2 protein [Acidobacteriota bacterium]